jgi:hypothetical protein
MVTSFANPDPVNPKLLHPDPKSVLPTSVSDPDPVGSAFKLGLDSESGSVSGSVFRIQMLKNRFKKTKFTLTDFKDENRKMS